MISRPVLVLLLLLALAAALPVRAQTQLHITLGPEETLDSLMIHNAPNGHISFQQSRQGLRVWIDGRIDTVAGSRGKKNSVQGTFLIHPASWSTTDLEHPSDPVLNVFRANHDTINITRCEQDSAWFRDYAAINAVIPGPNRGELLAFIDGEFHPRKTGNPLLASIGLATSTDGIKWSAPVQIIQGNDVTMKKNCSEVTGTMKRNVDNEGAAGPSAVIRTDGTTRYIYLYYEDRVRLTQQGNPTSNIYVARAPYSSGGARGSWQKWTGSGWSSGKTAAAPVVTTPLGAGESAHPNVSYNSSLNGWLMVFHTTKGLYATKSRDGMTWDAPTAIIPFVAKVRAPSFPTLVTPGNADQQTTGLKGTLFYSREIDKSSPTGKNAYKGYRRSFTIAVAPQKKGCATPRDCCELNGGTWSGGRCH